MIRKNENKMKYDYLDKIMAYSSEQINNMNTCFINFGFKIVNDLLRKHLNYVFISILSHQSNVAVKQV